MKKIFTLIAAALTGLAISAQDCPTETMLYLLNGDDAANVEIELGISKNESATLQGFAFGLTKPEGASWKKAYGSDYFTAQGYAPTSWGALPTTTVKDIATTNSKDSLTPIATFRVF